MNRQLKGGQIDRQRGRQIYIERQKDKQIDRHKDIFIHRKIDKYIVNQIHRNIESWTDEQMDLQLFKQTYKPLDHEVTAKNRSSFIKKATVHSAWVRVYACVYTYVQFVQ